MNGVITPGVSAGSNHAGASDTWIANVICPSGAATVGAAMGGTSATARATATTTTSERRRFIVSSVLSPAAYTRPHHRSVTWRDPSAPPLRHLVRLDLEALLAECEQAAREDGEADRGGDPEEDQAEEVDGDHGRRVLRRSIRVWSGGFGSAPSVRARPGPRHNGQGKVARCTRSQ